MNFAVFWRLLLGACELIDVFMQVGRHRSKFSRLGDLATGIYARLFSFIVSRLLASVPLPAEP
jgi:hypothetical protein